MTPEENEYLTRIGPGTPMGALLRRFWIPFLLSEELPARDGAPVRVSLLGEALVAFRDSGGRVGLLDEHCAHRRASLFFGRNEENGLRCIYHGLKFDVTGRCTDMPVEPPGGGLKDKVRLTAYPVTEAGGILWAYLGPQGTAGELPEFEWLDLPASHRYVSRSQVECNFVQILDGEIDSAHFAILHRVLDAKQRAAAASFGAYVMGAGVPELSMTDIPAGIAFGARRPAEAGRDYWRINPFLLPFYTMIAPVESMDSYRLCRAWVPASDTLTSGLSISYHPDRPLTEDEIDTFRGGRVAHVVLQPGTLRARANRDNDYLIDRGAQKSASFSGIAGVRTQDAAVTESAGPITDRSREFLLPSDAPVIALRKHLMQAARSLAQGRPVPATAGGRLYSIRPWAGMLDGNLKGFDADPVVKREMRLMETGAAARN